MDAWQLLGGFGCFRRGKMGIRASAEAIGQVSETSVSDLAALYPLTSQELGGGFSWKEGQSGELAGDRTQDPRLKRAVLYQLSYELTTVFKLSHPRR
jgi:hypothetical protein